MVQIAKAQTAILLGHGDAMQAKLAHLGPELTREAVTGVDLGGQRCDLLGGEAGSDVTDGVGGLAKAKIHRGC